MVIGNHEKVKEMVLIFVLIMSILILLLSSIFVEKAYAYLDPGTGSYFFQLLIATVIGILFTIKIFWSKITIFFKNLFSGKKKNGKI